MTPPIGIFVFLLALMSPSNNIRAQDLKLDPVRLEEVKHMAHTMPDDTMYGGMREEMGDEKFDAMMMNIEQHKQEREDFVRNSPDITPYLFFLLDREYNINRDPFFASIMIAISKRNDLTSNDLNKITGEMNEILNIPPDEWNESRKEHFLIGGVLILKRFPSPQHDPHLQV